MEANIQINSPHGIHKTCERFESCTCNIIIVTKQKTSENIQKQYTVRFKHCFLTHRSYMLPFCLVIVMEYLCKRFQPWSRC